MVGDPVGQSLSPLIQNAWIAAAGLDAVYVPFAPARDRFEDLILGLKGSSVAGVNVTLPFKEAALGLASWADAAALAAGAANLLLFHDHGAVEARNTDGVGLLYALDQQAKGWRGLDGEVVVLGAGGAARGAVAALARAGVRVHVANRTLARAKALAGGAPGVQAVAWTDVEEVFRRASVVINATSVGLEGQGMLDVPLHALAPHAVAMDMVYKPLQTAFLRRSTELGLRTVDGLAMLIGQAIPSFEALFDQPVPPQIDVRALALATLDEGRA